MFDPKRIVLTALLLALPCTAQTPAELLQKGIYQQETEGNLDGAIQIYRQITGSAPAQSPIAAQAQYRLAEVLLQKGDLNGAATEFNILASRYFESQALIAKMAGRLSSSRHQVEIVNFSGAPLPSPAGTVQAGHFASERTSVQFTLPSSWKVTYNGPSSDNGDIVTATEPGVTAEYAIWMRPEVTALGDIAQQLRASVPAKAKMNEDRQGFTFRPESIQPRTLAGHQVLSAVADYVEDNHRMVASYTWIYTTKTHAMFAARGVPIEDYPTAQAHLDQLVATAVVP